MADVSIKIQLQDTIEDVIGGVSADKVTNNVSSIVSKNTQKNDGTPLLSFAPGYIKFDVDGNLVNADEIAGKAILEGTYNGFVFGATNASGEYSVTLTISGSHIDSLIFYGDKLANQFPVEAYLDGDTANKIYSDDYIWAIVFDSSTTSHTVTFTKWNRANYNACFTHIAVLRNELWLDKAWIKNVESVSQCTGQPNEIFYGVIANSGSAEILDRNGELLDYITDGIIENSNLPVSIWANGKQVQSHITNDSDYDINSITLNLEYTNDISKWDETTFNGMLLGSSDKTLYEIFCFVLNKANYTAEEIDSMLNKNILVGNSVDNNISEMSIKTYLQSITIPNPYLEPDTIKSTIDKICSISQLQLYENDLGEIKLINARPIMTIDEKQNVIVISSNVQKSQLTEQVVRKNNYDNVKISYISLSEENKKEKYASGEIIAYSGTNYIGDDEGVNSPFYNIESDLLFEFPYQTGKFNIDISSFDFPYLGTDDNYEIELSKTISNYEKAFDDAEYKNMGESSVNTIASNYGMPFDVSVNTTVLDYMEEYSITKNYGYQDMFVRYENKAYRTISNKTNIGNVPTNKNYWEEVEKNKLFIKFGTQIYHYSPVTTENSLAFHKYLQNYIIRINVKKWLNSVDKEIIFGSGSNTIEIASNELMQDGATFNDKSIMSTIGNNILDDYSNGISNASTTISCSNYYDINGNLVKDWSKGEIIQVGDIVRIDKDNEGNSASSYKDGTPKLWRVTGRTFRKQGVPLIDLELQEIRQYFKVVFMNGDEVYATQLVDHGEKATAPSDPSVGTGYTFEGWFTADNQEFNFNTPINQDITLYAKIEPQQISVTYDISPNTTISIERLSSNKKNATIGPITTSDTIYYNDQIKYVVSSSSTYDYIGITINDVDYETANASLPYTITITNALQIKTFIERWTLISKQTVNVLYPNKAGSATTDVVVNNYNYGEELRVNTTLYLHLKNKITNNIDTLNLYIGQSGSDWLTSPGNVPFGWAVPSSIYESYYPFSIDFEFSPQSADSDITITVTKENADDFVSASGPGMSFYALRKS